MSHNFYRRFAVLLGAVILSFGTLVSAFGSELSAFTVRAVIPDNQLDRSLSYFDLRMEPGQKQMLSVEIINNNNYSMKATIAVNNASTGTNGTIVYSLKGIHDDSMVLSVEEAAKVLTPELIVPANSSVFAEIALEMPEKEFEGTILGGIYVTAEPETAQAADPAEGGIQIENKLAYVIGLKLHESPEAMQPNLNLLGVKPAAADLRTAVAINLQNSRPVIMKGISIQAEVFSKNENTLMGTASAMNAEAAPNSHFDFIIDWNGKKIEPGKYRLKMTANYQEYVWEWDEEFEIGIKDSQEVNAVADDTKSPVSLWWYVIPGSLLFLILLFIAYILGRRSGSDRRRLND